MAGNRVSMIFGEDRVRGICECGIFGLYTVFVLCCLMTRSFSISRFNALSLLLVNMEMIQRSRLSFHHSVCLKMKTIVFISHCQLRIMNAVSLMIPVMGYCSIGLYMSGLPELPGRDVKHCHESGSDEEDRCDNDEGEIQQDIHKRSHRGEVYVL